MTPENSSPYTIGYCKPPKETQFKAGKSGNPKGRPKGKLKNFATILADELNAIIAITEQGRRKKISKQHAIIKQLINKSIAGDPQSVRIILKVWPDLEERMAKIGMSFTRGRAGLIPKQSTLITAEEAEKAYKEMLALLKPRY